MMLHKQKSLYEISSKEKNFRYYGKRNDGKR